MSLLTPPFTHKIFFSLNPSRGNRSSTWKLQTWVSFKLGWTFVMPAGFPNPGAVFQLHEAQCSRDFFPRDLCFSRKPQWRWDCLRDEKSLCAGTDQPEVAASPNLRKQVAAPPSSVLTLIAGAVQGTPLSPMRFARHPEIGMHGGSFPAALKLTQEDAFSSPCWVSSAVLLYFCLIIFVVSLSFYFCCIFFVLLFLLYSCLFIFFEFLSFFCCILVLLFLLCFFVGLRPSEAFPGRAATFGAQEWVQRLQRLAESHEGLRCWLSAEPLWKTWGLSMGFQLCLVLMTGDHQGPRNTGSRERPGTHTSASADPSTISNLSTYNQGISSTENPPRSRLLLLCSVQLGGRWQLQLLLSGSSDDPQKSLTNALA